MLSTVQEAEGQYDEVIKQLLLRPRADVGRAIDQIHTRLLWCQMDPDDLAMLRDHVLVPTVKATVATPPKDQAVLEDLISLFALLPPPADPEPLASYNAVRAALKPNAKLERLFATREASARRQRTSPPPMIKRVNFCGVSESSP
jgi:hypothetical protein